MAETMLQWMISIGLWQFAPTHPLRAWRCWLLKWVATIMLAFGLLCLAIGWAFAQDGHGAGHAEYHEQYRQWKQPGIFPPISCCNAREVDRGVNGAITRLAGDCYPTDFRLSAKGWEARLSREDWERNGGPEWIPVPDAKIIRQLNPDQTGSRGHLCMSISDVRLLCAVPPTGAM